MTRSVNTKKKESQTHRCGDCKEGEVYMEFFTLSIKGEPTMKSCPYFKYKRLMSEKACDKFKE